MSIFGINEYKSLEEVEGGSSSSLTQLSNPTIYQTVEEPAINTFYNFIKLPIELGLSGLIIHIKFDDEENYSTINYDLLDFLGVGEFNKDNTDKELEVNNVKYSLVINDSNIKNVVNEEVITDKIALLQFNWNNKGVINSSQTQKSSNISIYFSKDGNKDSNIEEIEIKGNYKKINVLPTPQVHEVPIESMPGASVLVLDNPQDYLSIDNYENIKASYEASASGQVSTDSITFIGVSMSDMFVSGAGVDYGVEGYVFISYLYISAIGFDYFKFYLTLENSDYENSKTVELTTNKLNMPVLETVESGNEVYAILSNVDVYPNNSIIHYKYNGQEAYTEINITNIINPSIKGSFATLTPTNGEIEAYVSCEGFADSITDSVNYRWPLPDPKVSAEIDPEECVKIIATLDNYDNYPTGSELRLASRGFPDEGNNGDNGKTTNIYYYDYFRNQYRGIKDPKLEVFYSGNEYYENASTTVTINILSCIEKNYPFTLERVEIESNTAYVYFSFDNTIPSTFSIGGQITYVQSVSESSAIGRSYNLVSYERVSSNLYRCKANESVYSLPDTVSVMINGNGDINVRHGGVNSNGSITPASYT